MISLGKKFHNVNFYMNDVVTTNGTIEFFKSNYSFALYFREDGEKSENPFLDDKFIFTSLTQPFIFHGKHRLYDLCYYSEITIIETPFRLCFHDPSQEPGFSLNFRTKEEFNQLYNFLYSNVTIQTPGLPGFFNITHFFKPIFNNIDSLHKKIEQVKTQFLSDSTEDDPNMILEAQNRIMPKITPLHKSKECDKEMLSSALDNKDINNLLSVIREFKIPNDSKVDIWCKLIDIGDIGHPDHTIIESYQHIKQQFMSITTSQYKRSSARRKDINDLTKIIYDNKDELLSVVADESILKISFNVIMAVLQTCFFLRDNISEMISIFRVLLWLFVRSVKGGKTFEVKEGVEYDVDTLESVLYWSLIFVINKFDLKFVFNKNMKKKIPVVDYFGDLCFILHPRICRLIYSNKISSFTSLNPLFSTLFSTMLSLSDCADVWIFCLSSPDPMFVMVCTVLSGIFFYFPNLSTMGSSEFELIPTVTRIFKAVGHDYLMRSGGMLMSEIKNIAPDNFEELTPFVYK